MTKSLNCEKLYRLSQSELLLIKGGHGKGDNCPNDESEDGWDSDFPGK